jgi:serine/threonine-protein kinase RsbW
MQPTEVVLRIPADTSYVSLVRTATAAVSAQADFTVDALDDLRLAVDEACALAISDAVSDITVTFRVSGSRVAIDVCTASASGRPVATNTFAWTVLTALVDDVETDVTDGTLRIHLCAHGIESVTS